MIRYILSDYLRQAMDEAVFDKLEDGTYVGKIPLCRGVLAFGDTLRKCENVWQFHGILSILFQS